VTAKSKATVSSSLGATTKSSVLTITP
jgi:hypothetical protein